MQPYAFNVVMPGGGHVVGTSLLGASLALRFRPEIVTNFGFRLENMHLGAYHAQPNYLPGAAHAMRAAPSYRPLVIVNAEQESYAACHPIYCEALDARAGDRVLFAETAFEFDTKPAAEDPEARAKFFHDCASRREQLVKESFPENARHSINLSMALNALLGRGAASILHEQRYFGAAAHACGNFSIAPSRIGDVVAVLNPDFLPVHLPALAITSNVTQFALMDFGRHAGNMKDATTADLEFNDLPKSIWDAIFMVEDLTQRPVRFVGIGANANQVFHRF